ncbi:hypothetical protein ACJRO7_035530 [Eucalyptus globulus]|uniref:Uncharacterized protein n=1 Tax=Eucalyptus globulus TaxID=34317 RepID=A0ABD3J7M3_EUCGL
MAQCNAMMVTVEEAKPLSFLETLEANRTLFNIELPRTVSGHHDHVQGYLPNLLSQAPVPTDKAEEDYDVRASQQHPAGGCKVEITRSGGIGRRRRRSD